MVDIESRQGRKRMSLVLLLVAAFWATPTCLAQQVTPYPPGVYGTWPIFVLNTKSTPPMLVQQDISVPGATVCTPTTTDNGGYTGELLLKNGPAPRGAGGLVGILLEVLWTWVPGTNAASLDWSVMNNLLIEAQACNLRVALSLDMPLAASPDMSPTSLPPWVEQQIEMIKTVRLDIGTVPVFWDPIFNGDRVAFIQAAAANIATLPTAVQQNIIAVLAQPFGATTDDWNIPHSDSNVMAWQKAGYSTSTMLAAGQMILKAAAKAFPSLNLKLPIQAEGTELDMLDGTNPPGTDGGVALATQVLPWAYTTFPGRFFAQLNFVSTKSPPDCVSPCSLDTTVSPNPVFDLIRTYQPQGVGLQDVAAAVDGGVPTTINGVPTYCLQNGGVTLPNGGVIPCTPPSPGVAVCDSVQYATVSQNSWYVVQTYAPTFWEISRGDATTATGSQNPCQITTDGGQDLMRNVFAAVTTQLAETSPTCAQNVDSEFYITRSGYVFNFGTKLFYQTVKLTNIGSAEIGGPIELVLDHLSPNGSLSNQSGVTTCAAPLDNNPYLNSPYIVATGATLLPGASVSVVLEFSNPTKAPTAYTQRMLAGAGTP